MADMKRKPRVLIIGAGVGGIATAARLARTGLVEVTVVEKNDFTGGRCSLIKKAGYRFDTGPSLLLLPSLFHRAFADLGTSLEAEGVELLKCEPNYRIFFHDEETFTLSTDLQSMYQSIVAIEGPQGFDGYLAFLKEANRHHSLSLEHVLSKNFGSWSSMLRLEFLANVFKLHPFQSIWTRAGIYFKTERLRRAFTFASMYMGMSPFEAPGTYSLLQFTECVEGIWYPRGGFHKVVEALINIGQRHGVVYSPSTTVSRVTLSPDSRTVTGVETASGGHIEADIVICNADLVYAYNNLLPQTNYAKRLSKRAQSCSSVSFYWSLSQIVPQLDIHNIFLAEKYKESFDDIFHGVGVPGEPSFYVNVPSRIDPSAAPAGKDAVVVLVPVASLKNPSSKSPDLTSSVDVAALRKSILTTIQARTGVSLSELIISETINTPESWQEQFNLYSGSILGLSHSFFNVLSFRPRIKHDNIKGLYFVGASTHPGTGVPVCLAGSGVTAAQVLKDLGVPETTGQPTQTIKAVRKLDQIEKSDGILQVLLLTIVSVVVLLAALKSASVFVNGITTMTRDQFSSLPMSPLLWPVVLLVSVMVGFTFFLRSQEPRRTLQKDW